MRRTNYPQERACTGFGWTPDQKVSCVLDKKLLCILHRNASAITSGSCLRRRRRSSRRDRNSYHRAVFAPGSASDLIQPAGSSARMTENWGQQVVVDDRAGPAVCLAQFSSLPPCRTATRSSCTRSRSQ